MTTHHLPLPTVSHPPVAVAPSPPAPLGSAAGFGGADQGLDWRRVHSAVLRFKWLICGVTLLGTAAGFAGRRFFKPQYGAQATIWIDATQRGGGDGDRRDAPGPIREGRLLDAQAWVDLLKSYVVLDQVVREQRLFLQPKKVTDAGFLTTLQVGDRYQPGSYHLTVDNQGQTYTLATPKGEVLEHGKVGESIGSGLGFVWAPPLGALPGGSSVEFTVSTLRDAARGLADSLDAQIDLEGNFLKLELRGRDPSQISAVVNAVAQRYVEVAADLKRQKLTELTKILTDQLGRAQDNLKTAEAALEEFRRRTITLPADRPAPGALGATNATGTATAGKLAAEEEKRSGNDDHKNHQYGHHCGVAATTILISHKIHPPL
jgi:uncharacterized protein involved in exopolysaccharide biosynthesis